MSLIVDQLLLQLSDPAQLVDVLSPPSDPTGKALHALIDAVYDMPFATIHEIGGVQVKSSEAQLPLFIPGTLCGTWQQTIPSYSRSEISLEQQSALLWIDLLATLEVTLVLEVDAGEVESVITRDIGDFDTLDDFRARFRFIDLDAFMAKHHLATVEQLKEAYHYLISEVRLKAPGPFDPASPANSYRFPLNVAVLIRDTVDVAGALRDAKLARLAAERRFLLRDEQKGGEPRTFCAPVVVFPEGALSGLPFTAQALEAFFATEQILLAFVSPA